MEYDIVDNSEKIFFQDQNVLVTQSRFVVNSKTYAMRNISSVTNYMIKQSINGAIILILIGVISMVFGGGGIVLGIILIVLGILIIATKKDTYSVQISSNSGESRALSSKDRDYIQKIVDAVNEAIIYRG